MMARDERNSIVDLDRRYSKADGPAVLNAVIVDGPNTGKTIGECIAEKMAGPWKAIEAARR